MSGPETMLQYLHCSRPFPDISSLSSRLFGKLFPPESVNESHNGIWGSMRNLGPWKRGMHFYFLVFM